MPLSPRPDNSGVELQASSPSATSTSSPQTAPTPHPHSTRSPGSTAPPSSTLSAEPVLTPAAGAASPASAPGCRGVGAAAPGSAAAGASAGASLPPPQHHHRGHHHQQPSPISASPPHQSAAFATGSSYRRHFSVSIPVARRTPSASAATAAATAASKAQAAAQMPSSATAGGPYARNGAALAAEERTPLLPGGACCYSPGGTSALPAGNSGSPSPSKPSSARRAAAGLPLGHHAGADADSPCVPPPHSPAYEAFLDQRRVTALLINLVSIMERMDEQIVPALSRPLGCAFRAGPHQLGLITFARSVVQALASPLGGVAGHFCNRVHVLFVGCVIWGFFCAAFSFSNSVYQGMMLWAFNGIGLSLIIPNMQSLIADYYTSTQRGEAFGKLYLTGAVGGMLGSLYATNLGGYSWGGVPGWRLAFLSVAAVSFAIGALTLVLAVDPRRVPSHAHAAADEEGHDEPHAEQHAGSEEFEFGFKFEGDVEQAAVHRRRRRRHASPPPPPLALQGGERGQESAGCSGAEADLDLDLDLSGSEGGERDERAALLPAKGGGRGGAAAPEPSPPPLSHSSATAAHAASAPSGEEGPAGEGGAARGHGHAVHGRSRSGGGRPAAASHAVEKAQQRRARRASAGSGAGVGGPVGGYAVEGGPSLQPSAAARPLTWQRIGDMVTMPSFIIIILQGIVGTTPWSAMVFLTLYLQLLGFSDLTASCLMALLLAGTAAGGLLGGWLGDRVAERYPCHGRIAITQFSVAVGVPLTLLLFKGLPMAATTPALVAYATLLLTKGILTSWAAPACNNPIFAEIVPPDMRNLIYAFDRSFEGAIGALGSPLVGMAAERWFGFTGVAGGEQACAQQAAAANPNLTGFADLSKARALGDAMVLFMALPWSACALLYSGLHWTYPRDRARCMRPELLGVFGSAAPAPALGH